MPFSAIAPTEPTRIYLQSAALAAAAYDRAMSKENERQTPPPPPVRLTRGKSFELYDLRDSDEQDTKALEEWKKMEKDGIIRVGGRRLRKTRNIRKRKRGVRQTTKKPPRTKKRRYKRSTTKKRRFRNRKIR
jgi:hypothetical protein